MNKAQKLVVTLLVVSLILSAVSIALNVAILKIDINPPRSTTQVNSPRLSSANGQLDLFVEPAPVIAQGGGANG